MYDEEQEEAAGEQELLEQYDGHSESGGSDAAAMQAVVCILIIVLLFVLNVLDPEMGGRLLDIIRELSGSTREIMPDPIEWVMERLFH